MQPQNFIQSISQLEQEIIQSTVERIGFRNTGPEFIRLQDGYLDKIVLKSNARVLEVGCGTGVVSRTLAKRDGFKGTIVGLDFSDALLETAKSLASAEGVAERIEFRLGHPQKISDPDESYDVVVVHTLISHVSDPLQEISEVARVLRPTGVLAVFDCDYASLSFGAGDPELSSKIVEAILAAVVTNPYVMRSLPSFFERTGLVIKSFVAEVHAETGEGSYFVKFAESYAPLAAMAGVISKEAADHWLRVQRQANLNGTFFGACNYYSFIAEKG